MINWRTYWFAWKVNIHQYHRVCVRLPGCCQRYRYWFNITSFVPRGPCNDWQAQFHFNHTLRCFCLYLIANIWNITSNKLISDLVGLNSCQAELLVWSNIFQARKSHWWYMMALFWLSGEDEEWHSQWVVHEKDETGGLTDLALLKRVSNYKLWNVTSCWVETPDSHVHSLT